VWPHEPEVVKKVINLRTFTKNELAKIVLPQLQLSQPFPPKPWEKYWIRHFRLFLPFVLPPTVSKYIWIDDDIIFEADVIELWQAPLHGAPVGVRIDRGYPISALLPTSSPGFAPLQVAANQSMVQAGIQIIDLHQWRQQQLFAQNSRRLFEIMIAHNWWFDDQSFLSLMLFSPHFNLSFSEFPPHLHVYYPHFSENIEKSLLLRHCYQTHQCIWHWNGPKPAYEPNLFAGDIFDAFACLAWPLLERKGNRKKYRRTSEQQLDCRAMNSSLTR
jgi:lipopolysaccharide biosynthesis glycosyltransferase